MAYLSGHVYENVPGESKLRKEDKHPSHEFPGCIKVGEGSEKPDEQQCSPADVCFLTHLAVRKSLPMQLKAITAAKPFLP